MNKGDDYRKNPLDFEGNPMCHIGGISEMSKTKFKIIKIVQQTSMKFNREATHKGSSLWLNFLNRFTLIDELLIGLVHIFQI